MLQHKNQKGWDDFFFFPSYRHVMSSQLGMACPKVSLKDIPVSTDFQAFIGVNEKIRAENARFHRRPCSFLLKVKPLGNI